MINGLHVACASRIVIALNVSDISAIVIGFKSSGTDVKDSTGYR